MNPRLRKAVLLSAFVLAVAAAPTASADFILNAQLDAGKAITATFNLNLPGHPGLNGTFGVGPLIGSLDGGQPFTMYCVDLYSPITNPNYQVQALPLSARDPGPDFTIDRGLIANLLTVGTTNSRLEGAAMQLAIWDAVYFGGAVISGGTFAPYLTNLSDGISQAALVGQTNAFLDSARAFQGPAGHVTYFAPTAGGQGMVALSSTAVPEPSSLVLCGLGGLLGLGLVARQRKSVGA